MTDFSGRALTPIIADYLPAKKNNGNTNFVWPFIGYSHELLGESIPPLAFGPRAGRPATGYGLTKNRGGLYMHGFVEDMYDRIFVTPLYISVGNLTSQQRYDLLFFNAYRTPQSILSVTPGGVRDGVDLAGMPLPVALGGLQEYFGQLTVSLEGPAVINATFTFAFTVEPPQTVTVTGFRIVTFAFEPDWNSEVEEKLSFWTQIIEAYSGKEQRISLRKFPRWSLAFEVINDGRAVNTLDSLMVGWSGRLFCLPDWTEKAILTKKALAGQYVVAVDLADSNLKAGDLAVLWSTPYDSETFEVGAVTAVSATLLTPLAKDHAFGSFLMPARLGRVGLPLAADYLTGSVVSFGAVLEPKEAESGLTPTPYPETYNGYQIVPFKHDFAEPLKHEYSRQFEEYDNGLGQYDYKDRHGQLHERFYKSRVFLQGRAEIRRFKNWLAGVQGRAAPFYIKVEQDQLQISRNVIGGQNIIHVNNSEFGLMAALSDLRNILVVRTKSGREWIARVTSYAPLDTGEVALYLNLIFPANFAPAEMDSVSFLRLVRLDEDEITIRHLVDGLAEVDLVFRGILL